MRFYAVRTVSLGKRYGEIAAGEQFPDGFGKLALDSVAKNLGFASWTDIARSSWGPYGERKPPPAENSGPATSS